MSGNNPNSGELSPTSNVQDFSRGKLRYKEKGIIMLSALALQRGEVERLYLHFGQSEEIEFLGTTENFVGKRFLLACFPKGVPPGFHGPVIGGIAVRGNDLAAQFAAVSKKDYILPLMGEDAMFAAQAMFTGLKEFLA
ncbi:MAG TPA: hypothetical protein VJ579_03250 [Candidatus Paceibacterota bacterium]|nr:hypothetical protein [Candidatus Paceibacterota bacterium]